MSAIHTHRRLPLLLVIITFVQMASPASGQLAGQRSRRDLVIAPGQPSPVVVVASTAGPSEKSAARDLARYVTMMCRTPVDITTDEMEVGPTCHYVMGGIEVDPDSGAAATPGLFAAGEK